MIGCKKWAEFLVEWFDGTPIWVCKSCRDYHIDLGSIIDHNQTLQPTIKSSADAKAV